MGQTSIKSILTAHAKRLESQSLQTLSANAADQSISTEHWAINTARHYLDKEARSALNTLAEDADLTGAVQRLFSAEIVNLSENRPALHWALRASADTGGDLARAVSASIRPALDFARQHARGDTFKSVLHIGIGGSDFGPRLIYDAFADKANPDIAVRFCANVDPLDLDRAIAGLDPATTLVIGVSKSFGTEETLYNLGRARNWLGNHASGHLALVTANPDRAKAWAGDAAVHLFDMPLSVGGRFSMWSAASLGCMLALGPDLFTRICNGAQQMDAHTQNAPIETNLPIQLALLDYWNATIRRQPMRVALAYSSRLRLLPTYLQQLEMESNGKTVGTDGEPVDGMTAPALWGGEGSIGQHSYHQWLHQGAQDVPAEFILALDDGADMAGQRALIAHCLAQAEVLANGRSYETINSEEPDLSEATARQKVHAGGRPSTLMICKEFGPEAFGSLLAMFEHRTYLAGVLWGLNSFDQWGVERGKVMAGKINDALRNDTAPDDPVTAALMRALRAD